MTTTSRSDALRIGSTAIVPGHVHGTEDVVADHGLLLGLGDDDHSQYHNDDRGDIRYYTKTLADTTFLKLSGGVVTGQLEGRGSLYLHTPGSTHARVLPGISGGGGYTLRVEDPGNSAVLLPVQVGNPKADNEAATPNWLRSSKYDNVMVSGPHGPLESYETVQHVAGSGNTVYSTALHHTSQVSGITRLQIMLYTQLRNLNTYSRASLSCYVAPYGRWHDGAGFSWTNNLNNAIARHTETKKAGTTSGDYGYRSHIIESWFVNRPGQRCSLGMMANVDNGYDGSVYAQFGFMRIGLSVFSNGTFDAYDSPAWGVT